MKKFLCVLSLAFALTITTADVQAQTTTKQKKGWSKKAKGAVIGGAIGAGTGVAVSKKNKKAAVIGGVVGAGAGYAIGRHKDKKSGRKSAQH